MALRAFLLCVPVALAGCIPIPISNAPEPLISQPGNWTATADGFAFSGSDGAQVLSLACDRTRGRLVVTVEDVPPPGARFDVLINSDNGGGMALPVTSTADGRTTAVLALGGAFQTPFATASVLRVAIGAPDPAPRFVPAIPQVQELLSTCP